MNSNIRYPAWAYEETKYVTPRGTAKLTWFVPSSSRLDQIKIAEVGMQDRVDMNR